MGDSQIDDQNQKGCYRRLHQRTFRPNTCYRTSITKRDGWVALISCINTRFRNICHDCTQSVNPHDVWQRCLDVAHVRPESTSYSPEFHAIMVTNRQIIIVVIHDLQLAAHRSELTEMLTIDPQH